METKEINQENIRALVKLGLNVEDIATVYLEVTKKGYDIPKAKFIDDLTKKLKYFQTRNNKLDDESTDYILKEDVLKMIKKNKKLIGLDIKKQIEPICEKIDGYYFMNPAYTNRLIKENANIFNFTIKDLDEYSAFLSEYAIKIDGQIFNLYEYIVKQKNEILNKTMKDVCDKIQKISNEKNSKLITKEELENL